MKEAEIYLALVVLSAVMFVFVVLVALIEIFDAVTRKIEGWRRGTGR